MSVQDISQAKDPLLRASFVALQRAARMAREEAIRTNTDLVIVQDGKVVHIPPEELRRAQLEEVGR
ncbi:hypothetical protein HHS34_010010 [Acidithiobacillus montserratensis]|uniref:Uncharacterized protein n=1 Tax=Acidithiobacillus montserratensis TaxID=2729135 RepID=A0ACD5HE10_9PROT|nr:hypothetical protein [Acidithiobacillus montserratensis]MBU2747223.1 hypothetical protein [Acidithiobacillus montserratensis]